MGGASLEVPGGLGAQRDDGVGGERRLDLRRQRVDGEALLLPDVAADGGQLSACGTDSSSLTAVSTATACPGALWVHERIVQRRRSKGHRCDTQSAQYKPDFIDY